MDGAFVVGANGCSLPSFRSIEVDTRLLVGTLRALLYDLVLIAREGTRRSRVALALVVTDANNGLALGGQLFDGHVDETCNLLAEATG